jgi:hypothetical protein
MNITTNMQTMTNSHGDCNASFMIESNHKKVTKTMTCHNDVWLLWLKHVTLSSLIWYCD